MLLDKAEPTTDEIEKAVVTSCYGGHPTLITLLSNKLVNLEEISEINGAQNCSIYNCLVLC